MKKRAEQRLQNAQLLEQAEQAAGAAMLPQAHYLPHEPFLPGCMAYRLLRWRSLDAHEIAHVLVPLQHGCAYCASCANDVYLHVQNK